MKFIIILCLLFSFENSFAARYCVNNGNQISGCYDNLKICKEFENKNFRKNDECRPEVIKTNFPPSLKRNSQGAYCLWLSYKSGFKNMGCMVKTVCEYSMRQYPQTICAKGSLSEMGAIKKLYLAHEAKLNSESIAAKKEVTSKENAIYEKGTPKEIIQLIKHKNGRLELTSIEALRDAQKKLESFCSKGNAEACFVLYNLYSPSDFKAAWNLSAESQCNDLKKSYEYLNRSCMLSYNEACQDVISEDDLNEGLRSNSSFIQEPGQNGVANDEAKGIDCKVPKASPEVYRMKEQCSKQGRTVELCTVDKFLPN